MVDTGDHFGTGSVRAQLSLVRKILQRIFVPEFHFHAPIQRSSLLGSIGCDRLCGAPAHTFNGSIRQSQIILNSECNAPGNRFGETGGVAVDAFVPSLQRYVIRVSGEFDDQVFFAAKMGHCPHDLQQKLFRHTKHTFVVMKGRNQVLNACTMGVAIFVAQLTHGFGSADLDTINFPGNDRFFLHLIFDDLVIPYLHFHAPVEPPSFLGAVVGIRLTVAKPFIGDGFRGKIQRVLTIFGYGASPFTGQPHIVTVLLDQIPPKRQGIGVAHKVESNIGAVTHAVKHVTQQF